MSPRSTSTHSPLRRPSTPTAGAPIAFKDNATYVNARAEVTYPAGADITSIRGAAPGAPGETRVRYRAAGAAAWSETPWRAVARNIPHSWVYRGQVLPTDREVTVVLDIVDVDDDNQRFAANGFLTVDGRVIYQMTDFTLE